MALPLATGSIYGPSGIAPADTALLEALADRRVVLLLDNCEHLLAEISIVAEALLRHTTCTYLIATSREVIGVSGEAVQKVAPLAAPCEGDAGEEDLPALQAFPAVALFVERARAADHRFELASENSSDVARICRRLDGLPLALELAAARVRALTVRQIADLLDDRFRFLAGGTPGTPRHRTLLAAVDWSYDLLDDWTREIFSYLSVFRGGFQLEEAEQLGIRMGVPPSATTETVIKLVDKSLLQAVRIDGGGKRYRMLETLREYAIQKLGDIGRTGEAEAHHADLYVEFAERNSPHSGTTDQPSAIHVLEREDDNLRSAFEFGCRTGRHGLALRMINALGWYIWMRGDRVFGWPGVVRALGIRPDEQEPLQRARALIWSCHLGAVRTLEPEARQHGRQAREILERLRLTQGPDFAFCCVVEAFACYRASALPAGNARSREALQIADRLKDSWLLANSNLMSAVGKCSGGDFAAARPLILLSARHYRRIGDRWGEHRSLVWQSRMYEALGDLANAEQCADYALTLVRSLGLVEATAPLYGWLAHLRLLRGDRQAADAALEAVEKVHWWKTIPEAVAWVTECRAVMAEQRARASGQLSHAAGLHGEAARHLAAVGQSTQSVQSRCRQALLLARLGKNHLGALALAARSALTDADLRSKAFTIDASVLAVPTGRFAQDNLALADALWKRTGLDRPAWLGTAVQRLGEGLPPASRPSIAPDRVLIMAESLITDLADG